MSISATPRVTATTPHQMRRAGDMVIERDATTASETTVSGTTVSESTVSEVASSAVVQTEPPLRNAPPSLRAARPDTPFLAQLIATADQHPQTRALRRADVAVADMAYRAATNIGAVGSLTRRSV